MAKDIEKIIEDSYVPEMEYVKTKHFDAPKEVPEVVLPKTKAEMYEEAKDRLEQKTSAVSKSRASDKVKSAAKERAKTKTVEPKRQKTKPSADAETKTVSRTRDAQIKTVSRTSDVQTKSLTRTREKRANVLHRLSEDPKWVGGEDELVPFAWRKPLVDVSRPSKYYRQTVRDEKARAQLLPVPRDK